MTPLGRAAIEALVPQKGGMCLLDGALTWSGTALHAIARSHLSPHNPLRRGGRLGIVCGAEYGLQAAALHGALRAVENGGAAARGYVASLSLDHLGAERLDEVSIGLLNIHAMRELDDPRGTIYGFALHAEDGRLLLRGKGSILFPAIPG